MNFFFLPLFAQNVTFIKETAARNLYNGTDIN